MNPVILVPGVRKLRNGKRSAKDYPYWDKLIPLLKQEGYEVKEIIGEPPLKDLEEILKSSLTVICCDSFIQHFCWSIGKKAIVLWGVGDPLIFGHPENINLIKSRNNLRDNQFDNWENVEYHENVFVSPEKVVERLKVEFSQKT